MELKDCIDAFKDKIAGMDVSSLIDGPKDAGEYGLVVDGEKATVLADGHIVSASPGLFKNLEKHFAPFQKAYAKANPPEQGPSELPTQTPAEEVPEASFQPAQETPEVPAPKTTDTQVQSAPKAATSIYDQIIETYGPDLIEVFGESGNLKTKGFVALALATAQAGKKVLYLDTENNLSPAEKKAFVAAGVQYKYTPVLAQIHDIIMKTIPAQKVDLVIVDSVGMPILRMYATLSAKQKGDALLQLIAWLGVLKEWSFNNGGIALVSNQPSSEFGKTDPKDRGDNRFPFGDKGNYIPGHILLAKKDIDGEKLSKGHWLAFRSRTQGRMAKAFAIEVDKSGSRIAMCEVA